MATNLTDAELAEYRTPSRSLGRCVCGRQAWTEVDGKPMHPCCARLGDDCEACATADSLDRQQARVRQWARRTGERSHAD